MTLRIPLCIALVLLSAAPRADAATSYDGCTAFITTLPATLSSPGRYCLTKDLATASSSGHAITVAVNNVTLDCNGFKIGNLAAGLGTSATGVFSTKRNTRVTDCHFRGFQVAVDGIGAHGAQLDGNVFEGTAIAGVALNGLGIVVRDNRFLDIGGTTLRTDALAVSGRGEVRGNQIDGVASTAHFATGISGIGEFAFLDNSIRGVQGYEGGAGRGIWLEAAPGGSVIAGNRFQSEAVADLPFLCDQRAVTRDNTVVGAEVVFSALCADDGGNVAIVPEA